MTRVTNFGDTDCLRKTNNLIYFLYDMNISRQDCRVCSKTSIYYIYVFSIDVNIVAYMYIC